MDSMVIVIEKASNEDAAQILALQKLAYRSEAEIIDDFSIPPLHQTLDETLTEFQEQTVLKVQLGERVIGSVRAYQEGETCYIGKLIVHPDFQNRGIGSRLLRAAEELFPNAERYELFTGEKSARNLYLYRKYGYRVFRSKRISDKLTLLYLEKQD